MRKPVFTGCVFFLLAVGITASGQLNNRKTPEHQQQIEKLVDWMTGYFSSRALADTSSDKYHVDVRLRMRQIWKNKNNGYWIYVEQAYASDTANPYRQRVYRIYEENSVIKDEIYSITNDSLYVYGWKKPEIFDSLTLNDLALKEKCGVTFKWDSTNNGFTAKTNGNRCKAAIPGVSYITSESEIYKERMLSWDLGYNDDGKIVMGPESPYIFEKTGSFSCNK